MMVVDGSDRKFVAMSEVLNDQAQRERLAGLRLAFLIAARQIPHHHSDGTIGAAGSDQGAIACREALVPETVEKRKGMKRGLGDATHGDHPVTSIKNALGDALFLKNVAEAPVRHCVYQP